MEYEEDNLETKWLDTWFIIIIIFFFGEEHVNSESSYKSPNNLPEIWPPGTEGFAWGPGSTGNTTVVGPFPWPFFCIVLCFEVDNNVLSLRGTWSLNYELWIMNYDNDKAMQKVRDSWRLTPGAWREDFTSIFDGREKQNCYYYKTN